MKKINNKGTTIAELLVTFVVLMMIVVAMLRIVTDIKEDSSNRSFKKDMLEFNDEIIYKIQTDLITNSKEVADFNNYCDILSVSISSDESTVDKIVYDGVSYNFPNFESIGSNPDKEVSCSIDNNILTISIPYIDQITNDNYEIKIVHPLNYNQ